MDFDNGAIIVEHGKGKKERALSLVDSGDPSGGATLKLLADWIEVRATISLATRHNRLWTSMKGNPLSTNELRRILTRICAEAGLSEKPAAPRVSSGELHRKLSG